MNVESLSRGEKEEMLTVLEERAIKVPAGGHSSSAKGEAEARPLAGKADAYDRGAELEDNQESYTTDAPGLLRFLKSETLPW